LDAKRAAIPHVRVDHRRSQIAMTEQLFESYECSFSVLNLTKPSLRSGCRSLTMVRWADRTVTLSQSVASILADVSLDAEADARDSRFAHAAAA